MWTFPLLTMNLSKSVAAVCIAGLKIHEVDLIKQIIRLTLTLKDHQRAVGTEIAFPGPVTF